MSVTQLRIISAGLFFLFIFLSGFWLSHLGKPPYPVILLTVHKLIGLAAVVYLVITINRVNQMARLNSIEFIVCIISAVFFLSTVISGGLASIDKPMPAIVLRLHQISPYLTVLSTAVTLYLLISRKVL